MGDRLQEAREIGNVGAVYLAMGEFDSAVDCHTQHLRLARRLGDQVRICENHNQKETKLCREQQIRDYVSLENKSEA